MFIRNSDKIAVATENSEISYTSLLKTIALYSDILGKLNGKRVLIVSENRPEYIYAFYGIWKSGGILVPVDFMSTSEEIAYVINDCSPDIVFLSEKVKESVSAAIKISGKTGIRKILFEEITGDISKYEAVDFDVEDKEKTSLIIYTSGTTGSPKGVMLSYRNIMANMDALQECGYYNSTEVVLMVLPLHHAYPLIGTIVAPIIGGGRTVICPTLQASDIAKMMEQHHPTMILAVPRFYEMLMKGIMQKINSGIITRTIFRIAKTLNCTAFSKFIFKSIAKKFGGHMRHFICGGANLDPAVWNCYKVFGFLISDGYGMTEAGPMIAFPRPGKGKAGCVGTELVKGTVKIVDGEIVATGENIMQGYYNRPEETAEVLKDGWLYTGDLGHFDKDGNLCITGRKKEIIILGNGKNINPAEIEHDIKSIDALIKEIAVTSKNDFLCAIIRPDENEVAVRRITNLEEFIRREIIDKYNLTAPHHKKIVDFILTNRSLPRTRLDKIQRFKIEDFLRQKDEKLSGNDMLQNKEVPAKEFIEAETEEEKALVEAVKKVLKIEKVNMADNFYELGGDSIQAIFVVAALRKAGFELSMMDVARSDTLGKIALRLKRISDEDGLSILRGEKTVLPESATIASLFEETAAKKADETCIVTDDKNYTFAEFNALVKLIDSEIRKITHGKKQTIAVAAERSIEMYASIYAIIRGGNAYLPIDPAYPKGRIEYMLENSGAELVLTQDKFCSLFNGIKVLNVSETIKSGNAPTEDLPVSALSEDTAYMIYTSGSTGRPKGAKVSHRSLLNRIMWMEKAYPLDENSVILQKTPFTFDVSLWEIFLWGVSGGKMAFMKPDEHFLPAKITDEIYRKKATVAHFVPSVLDLFVKYLENNPGEREKVSTLKDVFVSGEVLNASLINRFYAMFSAENVKIHNLYGPAECAVDVTFYDCKPHESDPLPIGKPIDNTDIFILDSNMQAVPKGVVGEICIGGANVGQGYVNSGDLTNEVFLKNPFGEGKIYKTGDLGYISSENEIIFSGRKDSQIKLNGQRVELAEIENSLSEIEGVALAAVVERKNSEGNQILCAFYSGEKKESAEIRNELGKKLPHYMIPQIITHLDAMPLTSSGKIDRLSLPDTDLDNIVSDKEFIEARTEEEKALVEAVKKVLKTDRVSVNDNFFELGGDSIQTIFVVAALRKAGFEFSVLDVSRNATIETTALLLKRISDDDGLSILRGEKTVLPESETIFSLFEKNVAEKCNEICTVTDDKNYTFAEFNDLVKLIDFEIRKITGEKKQTVAVVAERSIEMYAAVYAVMRGGNIYLPIDPAYPEERIEYMLENSGAKLVLAQDRFCALFDKIKVLNISETVEDGDAPAEDLPVSALQEDTAYMIYTSGSTGRPKGAKISQRSLLNRILWMEKQYPLDEKSVILQKTPFTFDVSLWEIFWWGLFGGKMAFMKPKEHFLPEKITDEIYNRKVTIIHFVPSVFDLFVKYLESNPAQREKISTLKHIFISGEVLSAALINRFYALFESKKIKLHNLYGPTECAVDVTFYDCKKEESDPLPIGRPIDNTDIFIMDNLMNLLPKGVIGEICIGGVNVGVGYVNNDALTDEVFVKNPFGEGKIYKTGDLGYINSENEIIFCGRKDHQIKLNGQRVELGEIENAISEIEGVTLSSVVVRQNKEETQVLCAFYSGKKKESLEIRKELEKKLPRYMIPQIITHLDEMPLTSSGKINRLSLPEIDLENIVSDKEFVGAKTDEEKALVEAVKKVLKIDKVSMTDNFFELGGDSIQAIFVVSVLQKAGFELSVADITLHGTIAEIALLMKSTDKPDQEEETRANILIPLTPIMKIYSNIGGMKLKEIAQTQIVSCGKSGENEIRKAVDTIVKHHDMLRAVLEKNGLKIKSFEECRPYEMKVKNLREKKEYVEFIENDCDGVDLDLENGPLVNTVVYLTDSENFLKITIHHFVIDGVSWRIIADDLSIALEQLSTGKEIRLPERTASFRAWIENLEDYKRISIANELNYWNNTLNSLDKVPDLISNCSEVHEYDEYSFTFEKTFTEQLLTSANKAFGTHADELLLSALGTALKEVYGKNDFGVCIETHGREQLLKNIDVSRTVGWFTSYFPMVLRCGETLDGTIVNIKDAIRGVPKKGIAYPLLFGRIPGKADLIYNFNGVLREGNKFTKETFRKNAARNAIPDKIAINSIVLNGELCVFVSFKGNIQANAAAALGIEYEKQLKNLISCCAEYKGSVKTLSDYSDQDLQESELEDFEKMFNEVKNE